MATIEALVAKNIRLFRQRAGLSQQKLAERTGISLSYINLLENSETDIGVSTLKKVAEGLGIPPGALLTEDGFNPLAPPQDARSGLQYARIILQASLDMLGEPKAARVRKTTGKAKKKKSRS